MSGSILNYVLPMSSCLNAPNPLGQDHTELPYEIMKLPIDKVNDTRPWEHRIGADAWKQIINLECKTVNRLNRDVPLRSLPNQRADRITFAKPLEWEIVPDSSEIQAPFGISYLVFQTGRLFVVGPTKSAFARITRLQAEYPNQFPRPIHVVLLNWHEDHHSGLTDLLQVIRNAPDFISQQWSLTIWTSFWVWEELKAGNAAVGQLCKELKLLDSETELFLVDRTHASQSEQETDLRKRVIAFQREKEWELTVGVTLKLSYSLGAEPSLRAEFRCNNHRIIVDPALHRLLTPDLPGETSSPSTHAVQRHLLDECLANSRRFPSFAHDIGDRCAEVQGLMTAFMGAFANPGQGRQQGSDAAHFGLWSEQTLGLQDATAGVLLEHDSLQQFVPSSPGKRTGVVDSQGHVSDAILDRTAIVLLCGGLMNKTERGLIDPGFQLDISFYDADSNATLETMSVLEWRLRQLNALALDYNCKSLQVLLLTTPETERTVRSLVNQYLQKCSNETCKLTIAQYAARLTVACQDPIRDPANYDLTLDGGWRLRPLGHMDALWLLHRWKSEPQHERKTLAMIFAINNLGEVINDTSLKFLSNLERTTTADMAVELFQYQQPANSDDRRWEQLSSCGSPTAATLSKRWYERAEAAPHWSSTQPPVRWYSSLTWYVNVQSPRFDAAISDPSARRFSTAILPHRTGQSLRQDLDFMSHDSRLEVCGIVGHDVDGTPIPLESLYRHRRYLGVRTQDHVRHARFLQQFSSARVGNLDRERQPRLRWSRRLPRLLVSAARPQEYHWGGYEIATMKRFRGNEYRQIAETWEISTYAQGQSAVRIDPGTLIPLETALDAKLAFMAKYLDCHKQLSIQVHPTVETSRRLYELHQSGNELSWERLKLRDAPQTAEKAGQPPDTWGGKEESFFVIRRAPDQVCHLYLGFERSSLTPLARRIALSLHEKAYQSHRDQELTNDLSSIWLAIGEAIKKHVIQDRLLPVLRSAAPEHWADKCEHELLGLYGIGPKALELAKQRDKCVEVLRFHLLGPGERLEAAHSGRLRGKEFLYVGIGIIALIGRLTEFVTSNEEEISQLATDVRAALLYRLRQVFGRTAAECSPAESSTKAGEDGLDFTFLEYFHRHRLKEDGCWVRIPPGTVHAWQGGGNLLIELGDRSDNTFRILDYGREMTKDARDMHYLAAMYSLNTFSFFTNEEGDKLIEGLPKDGELRPCHHLLDYRVHKIPKASSHRLQMDQHSFLMNPDGGLTLSPVVAEDTTPRQDVGRFSAVVAREPIEVYLNAEHEDNQVFHFFHHKERPNLLCLCLGGLQFEAALWRDPLAPAILWRAEPRQAGLEGVLAFLRACVESPEWKTQLSELTQVCVAVSWPGFRQIVSSNRSLQDNPHDKWFSTALGPSLQHGDVVDGIRTQLRSSLRHGAEPEGIGKQFGPCVDVFILSDVQAAVLGEIRHPMGQVQAQQPSLLLNIGQGVCVGFFCPSSADSGPDSEIKPQDLFRDNVVTQCSAVGRWLFYSLDTGECTDDIWQTRQVGTSDSERNAEDLCDNPVFTDNPQRLCEGRRMRASRYLGAKGLVARHMSAVAANSGKSPWREWCMLPLEDRLQKLDEKEHEQAVHEGLRRLYSAIFVEADGGQIVSSFAQDLAALIKHVCQRLEEEARKREVAKSQTPLGGEQKRRKGADSSSQDPLSAAQLRRLARECPRRIVLTGPVGQSFGLKFDPNPKDEVADPLVEALKHRLPHNTKVHRSVIRPGAEREAAGFLYYLDHLEGGEATSRVPTAEPPPAPQLPSGTPVVSPQPTEKAGTIVLLTVNKHETEAVLDVFRDPKTTLPPETIGGVTYSRLGAHGGYDIVHTISAAGSGGIGGAGQRTFEAIAHWNNTKAVIAVGIAFGMDETKQKIGDVLIASQIQPYDLVRVNNDGTITLRASRPDVSPWLLDLLKHTIANRNSDISNVTIHDPGLILSGEKLVDNFDYRESLKRLCPEAIGGEMEALGVYASAARKKVDWIVIKAICDWGHNKNHPNKDAWQRLAARNAAAVLKCALNLARPDPEFLAPRADR